MGKNSAGKQHRVSGCSAACHREGPLTRLSRRQAAWGRMVCLGDSGAPAERPRRPPERGMAQIPWTKCRHLNRRFFWSSLLDDGLDSLALRFP